MFVDHKDFQTIDEGDDDKVDDMYKLAHTREAWYLCCAEKQHVLTEVCQARQILRVRH